MRRVAHWKPRYIVDRLAVEFYRRARKEQLPLLALGAVQFLDGWLEKTDRMLEYGAGHSTAWFARRVAGIVSVESDPDWYSVAGAETSSLSNVELHLIASKDNPTRKVVGGEKAA